uniref:Amine oxidase n=1 Tax=Helicotheca tamesis TaxID=374047 RepID=A0A7S2HQ03_9STRA|mmetsp:Transcript_1998/g.2839  ORF Transcript_1998/g.2839 Transcript_1998/m.2839 type:complete len:269 (+) Transcript_1998:58-864(+)
MKLPNSVINLCAFALITLANAFAPPCQRCSFYRTGHIRAIDSSTEDAPTINTFEYLKFKGTTPDFDVVQKTKELLDMGTGPGVQAMYADDYVLRGPVIGPLTRKDLLQAQGEFEIDSAIPDLKITRWGFTADPTNPWRCFWFEKWTGTHTGTLKTAQGNYEPTGNYMDGVPAVFSVVWNPEGKVQYRSVGYPVERHEGNTDGKAAVFGVFHTVGLKIPGHPGSRLLRFFQRLGHKMNPKSGRSWSREEDIPTWWTSKSRGADLSKGEK